MADFGSDLYLVPPMHLRAFVLCCTGVMLNLLIIWMIVTPILPYGPRWYRVVAHAPLTPLDPNRRAVLPAHTADSLRSLCGRQIPDLRGGSWDPSPETVRNLDVDLAAFLTLVNMSFPQDDPPARDIRMDYRQYVAVAPVIDTPVILILGASPTMLHWRGGPDLSRWRQEVVDACGHTHELWSVVYEPNNRAFRSFTFSEAGMEH